jgi:hypothetical protein
VAAARGTTQSTSDEVSKSNASEFYLHCADFVEKDEGECLGKEAKEDGVAFAEAQTNPKHYNL